jgi:hypothetical protein
MIAEATNYYAVVSHLPEDSEAIFHGAASLRFGNVTPEIGSQYWLAHSSLRFSSLKPLGRRSA